MQFQTSVKNNATVPVGAGVIRSRLMRDGAGKVYLTREYIFRGGGHTVTELIPTLTAPTVQGAPIPVYKLQGRK